MKPSGPGKKIFLMGGVVLFLAMGFAIAVILAVIDDRLYRSGVPLAAQGSEATKTVGGAQGAAVTGPVGASAAELTVDAPVTGLVGAAPGRRQLATSAAEGATNPQLADASATVQRSNTTTATPGAGEPVAIPTLPAEVAQANIDHLAASAGRATVKRQSGGPVSVDIAAVEGPGGLGS